MRRVLFRLSLVAHAMGMLFVWSCSEKSLTKKETICAIDVISVYPLITTPASMKPKNFFWTFVEQEDNYDCCQLKRRTIVDKDSIYIVMKMLSELKPSPDCPKYGPDTRGVLLVKYSNHTDTLGGNPECFGYHGQILGTSDKLRRVIWGNSFVVWYNSLQDDD